MAKRVSTVQDFEAAAVQAMDNSKLEVQSSYNEFMCDCLKKDIKTAYLNLAERQRTKGIVPEQALKQADVFLNKVYLHFENYLKEQLDVRKYEFTKNHERLITEFCTELVTTSNFDNAFRSATEKIRLDPVLSGDSKFVEQFNKLAEKVKPKKEQYSDLEITSSDGMFFMIRVGQSHYLDVPKTDKAIEEIVTQGLLDIHNEHLPKEEHVTKGEVELDVRSIMRDHQPSLATRLAQEDTRKISRMSHDAAKQAHEIMRQITRDFREHPGIYNINTDELTQKHRSKLMEFREAPRLSKTEKVDIVRELIITLSEIESPEKQRHQTYFPDSLKKQQKLDAFEKAQKRIGALENFAFEERSLEDPNKLKFQLQENIKNAKESILQGGNTREKFEDLLYNTYKAVMRWDDQSGVDMKHEKKNIELEVDGLTKGIRAASVKEALYEINERRLLYIRASVYGNYLSEAKKKGKSQIARLESQEQDMNVAFAPTQKGKPGPSIGMN